MTTTTKALIFKEAARLFREKGYNGSTQRQLADRVGVQGASIYHHFPSKQGILYAIMEYTMTSLLQKVRCEMLDASSPEAKLRKAIKVHIEYHTVDRDETYVADAELRSLEAENFKKIVAMRVAYEQIFRDILSEGVQEGVMRIGDVSLATKALLQMCTGISYWFSPGGRRSIDEIADQYVELFLFGICGKLNNER
ncbi:MAG: TetR/AcrR family transcriptional regulator [Proteobacteria bacterium]|nr:TetR/AcrR family transcriptional regulator [Pseudomonadota bacterium]